MNTTETAELLKDFFEQMEPEDIADWNRKQLLAWRERFGDKSAAIAKKVKAAKATVTTLAIAKETLAESRTVMAQPKKARKSVARNSQASRARAYLKELKATGAPRPMRDHIATMFKMGHGYAGDLVTEIYGPVVKPYRAPERKGTTEKKAAIRQHLGTLTRRPTVKEIRIQFRITQETASQLIDEQFGKFTKDQYATHGYRLAAAQQMEKASAYVAGLTERPHAKAIAKQFNIGVSSAGQVIRRHFAPFHYKKDEILKAFAQMPTRPSSKEIAAKFQIVPRHAGRLIRQHYGRINQG